MKRLWSHVLFIILFCIICLLFIKEQGGAVIKQLITTRAVTSSNLA